MAESLMLLQGLTPEVVSKDLEVCLSETIAVINRNRILDLAVVCGIEEFSSLADIREYLIFDSRITSDDELELYEEYDYSGMIYAYDLRRQTWFCKGRTTGKKFSRPE